MMRFSRYLFLFAIWSYVVKAVDLPVPDIDRVKVKGEKDPFTFINAGRLNTRVGYYGYRIVFKPIEYLEGCMKIIDKTIKFSYYIESRLTPDQLEKLHLKNSFLENTEILGSLEDGSNSNHLAADSLRLLYGSAAILRKAVQNLDYYMLVSGQSATNGEVASSILSQSLASNGNTNATVLGRLSPDHTGSTTNGEIESNNTLPQYVATNGNNNAAVLGRPSLDHTASNATADAADHSADAADHTADAADHSADAAEHSASNASADNVNKTSSSDHPIASNTSFREPRRPAKRSVSEPFNTKTFQDEEQEDDDSFFGRFKSVVKRSVAGAGKAIAGLIGVLGLAASVYGTSQSLYNFFSFGSSKDALTTRILKIETLYNRLNDNFGDSLVGLGDSVEVLNNVTEGLTHTVNKLAHFKKVHRKDLLDHLQWVKIKSKMELLEKASNVCYDGIEAVGFSLNSLRSQKLDHKLLDKKIVEDIFANVNKKAQEEGLVVYYHHASQIFDSRISYVAHDGKFEITVHIPVLHNSNYYDLYHYLPFPIGTPDPHSFYQFSPKKDIIATKIVDRFKRFIVTSYSELEKCTRFGDDYLCSDFNPPFLGIQNDHLDPDSRCLVEMYEGDVDKAVKSCVNGHTVPAFFKVQAVEGNKYYLATPMRKKIEVFCNGKLFTEDIVYDLGTITVPNGCEFTFGPYTSDKAPVSTRFPLKSSSNQIRHFTDLMTLYSSNVTSLQKEENNLSDKERISWDMYKEDQLNPIQVNPHEIVRRITERVKEKVEDTPKVDISLNPFGGLYNIGNVLGYCVVTALATLIAVLGCLKYVKSRRRGEETVEMELGKLPTFLENR